MKSTCNAIHNNINDRKGGNPRDPLGPRFEEEKNCCDISTDRSEYNLSLIISAFFPYWVESKTVSYRLNDYYL